MFVLCFNSLLPVPMSGYCQNQCTGLEGPLVWPWKLILLFFNNSLSGVFPSIKSSPCLYLKSFPQLSSSANGPFCQVHATLSLCQLSVPMLSASPHCLPGFHINSFMQSSSSAWFRLPVLFTIFNLPLESGLRDLQGRVWPWGLEEHLSFWLLCKRPTIQNNH